MTDNVSGMHLGVKKPSSCTGFYDHTQSLSDDLLWICCLWNCGLFLVKKLKLNSQSSDFQLKTHAESVGEKQRERAAEKANSCD